MSAKDVMGRASGAATRRGLLAAATAFGAAMIARVGSPTSVEAATGGNMIIGANNAATTPTALGNSVSQGLYVAGTTGYAIQADLLQTSGANAMLATAIGSSTAVFGDAKQGTGVFGNTASNTASPSPGVFGQGPKLGIWATTTSTGTALFAQIPSGASAAGSVAGFFDGPVLINGATTITGDFSATGMKSSIVPSNGKMVRLYALEAPESFFEDFGMAATGPQGEVTVSIPEDFRSVVKLDQYLVFLTAYRPNSGLFIANQTADEFVVRDSNGGANIAFSWRLVAKRADIEAPRFLSAGENLTNPSGVREVRSNAVKPDATLPARPNIR